MGEKTRNSRIAVNATRPYAIDTQKRVLLPKEVRDHLGVDTGDFLTFVFVDENGNRAIQLRKARWSVD